MSTSIMTPAENTGDDQRSSSACRCCGRICLLLVAAGAIGCSVSTILSCDFFRLIATMDEDPLTPTGTFSVGIFSYSVEEQENVVGGATCQAYSSNGSNMFQPSDWMGSMWIVAQYAALVAPCLAICATMLALSELLFGKFCGSFLLPAIFYIVAFATQGLTFFTYNEKYVCFRLEASDTDELIQNSCQLSYGAFLSMGAGFAYYICAVLICCLPRPAHQCRSERSSSSSGHRTSNWAGNGSDIRKGRTTSLEETSEVDLEAPTVSGYTRSTASMSQQQ